MKTDVILLIDAGATKTEFVIINVQGETAHYVGKGINPNYSNDEDIRYVFNDFVQAAVTNLSTVKTVFYYGAGCANELNASRIHDLISSFFADAEIQVYSDLMAVCHAFCGESNGMVAIFGTGSASCYYDGHQMAYRAPSLGYLLGDEGSGTDLGKRFLVAYLYGLLPDDLSQKFKETYRLSNDAIFHRLYQEPQVNLFFSSISPFLYDNLKYDAVYQIIVDAFSTFFLRMKQFYRYAADYYWYFSGSIAYNFSDILRETALLQGLMIKKVVAFPMSDLVIYHQNQLLCNK